MSPGTGAASSASVGAALETSASPKESPNLTGFDPRSSQQLKSSIIMFLSQSNNNRRTLRESLVPIDEKSDHEAINRQTIIEEGRPDSWLLARYHDESHVTKRTQFQHIQAKNKNLDELMKKLPFINPQQTFLLFWNLLVETAILFNLCEIPVAVFMTSQVYEDEFTTPTGIAINAIFIFVLFMHMIVVRPLTGFYKSGVLVKSSKIILLSYFKMEFWLNFISWVTLLAYAIANNSNFVYVKFLFYLQVYSMNICDEQVSSKLELKRLTFATYKLIKLVIILLFAVLWISCVYFAIDYHYYLKKDNYYPVNLWLTNSVCSQYQGAEKFIDLVEMYEWYVWLIYAFYWTLQSITGVGYGDMTPRNPPEVIYCNVVILFMSIAYAFFINNVWEIIAEVNQTGNEKLSHLKLIKKYQRKYKLDAKLTNRLGSYIYEIWSHGKGQETETSIKNSLSDDLRDQLFVIRQKQFFSGIPLFGDKIWGKSEENNELLQELASKLKEQKFGEGEIIFKACNFNRRIFLLITGEAKLQYFQTSLSFKCTKGMRFGVSTFLSNTIASYNASAKSFCKVSSLEYGPFIEAIKCRPLFHEKYCEKIEEITRMKRYELTGEDCWVCSSPDHPAHLCEEYFTWMFEMRDFEEVRGRTIVKDRRKSSFEHLTKKQERKDFNRRKIPKTTKNTKLTSLEPVHIDIVHSYKTYRPSYSI